VCLVSSVIFNNQVCPGVDEYSDGAVAGRKTQPQKTLSDIPSTDVNTTSTQLFVIDEV